MIIFCTYRWTWSTWFIARLTYISNFYCSCWTFTYASITIREFICTIFRTIIYTFLFFTYWFVTCGTFIYTIIFIAWFKIIIIVIVAFFIAIIWYCVLIFTFTNKQKATSTIITIMRWFSSFSFTCFTRFFYNFTCSSTIVTRYSRLKYGKSSSSSPSVL